MASRVPANLVSLPSLSSHLNALPQATSMSNVALHPHMYANRAAESDAKLAKALSKQAASAGQPQQPMSPYQMTSSAQQQDSSSPLMMRTKKFTT
ncbi:hypothetical protein H1R20_g11354, partial [Candolleomyces eurysporus]|uniref:Uncharacterized protein n=2 Tax=Candolleomyces TaxID=2791032 RepID=A0A4Q2DK17_9AGAR